MFEGVKPLAITEKIFKRFFKRFSNGPFGFETPQRWIPWDMDPRKQPGWQRLASPGAPLDGYHAGEKVWVYRGAGWSRGIVESLWVRGATMKVVVKLDDTRGGHPYTVCHDSRNICRRGSDGV